ncbi:MAG: sulfite exporter TauE/SafE family protein [Acidiphilium sp.]|nr:sulfite exporter TauE/SafE family protein [Acidiphilium sp.]MDD4935423.1 sulfite exporter TauE/SafE family protein [Acidiphilium sp.]
MTTAFVVAGFVVGLLIGLTGVGGGSVMTPLLVLGFGVHASAAIGTDLLFASVTKTVGTIIHGANRTVDWRIVGLMSCGSLPGALLALMLLNHIGIRGAAANQIGTTLLGAMLVIAAISVAVKPWLASRSQALAGNTARLASPWLTVALGIVLGITVTLSSVGAGALGTVALLYLYPGLPIKRVVGSDIAHAVALTLVAGLGRLWLHSVNLDMLGALLVGSIPGIIVGSLALRWAPERALRVALAIMLGFVGLRMLWKSAA